MRSPSKPAPKGFPRLDFISPDFGAVHRGKAVPVGYPPETCRCCLLPATRRVWVRWEQYRQHTADAVPCCEAHASDAKRNFRQWLGAIRSRDFLRDREREIVNDTKR